MKTDKLSNYKFFSLDFSYTCKSIQEKLDIASKLCGVVKIDTDNLVSDNHLTISFDNVNNCTSLVSMKESRVEDLKDRLIFLSKTDFINSISLIRKIKLNDEYVGEVTENGLKVGCQTIEYKTIEQAYSELKKAKLVK